MDAFRKYEELGWFLFPLKPRSKAPATPNGFKDATLTWDRELRSDFNVGLATGASRLIAVDIDIAKGGTLESLEALTGKLSATTENATGSGGTHLIYRLPEGVGHPATRLSLLHGVDILSATGYVIIPPSIHPNGTAYKWKVAPWELAPQPTPAKLIEVISTYQKPTPIEDTDGELFLAAGSGRWDHLRKFAGRLRSWGWGADAIFGALTSFRDAQVEEDGTVSDTKLRDLAVSICNKFPPHPNNEYQRVMNRRLKVAMPDGRIIEVKSSELKDVLLSGGSVIG